MEEGRKFIITESERAEVLHAVMSRNFSEVRGILTQLPEFKEEWNIDNYKLKKQEVKNNGTKRSKSKS
jgi:hypothetical protein